ncbi:hypothetical protein [Zooshikella sp. RANM57]|uniref:hypothetical protein n=1 Tax=Zooshikella sp. RANM57 TaxID=3425863 RepID=UPI003D6EC347
MKTEDAIIIGYTALWFSESSWSVERFASELFVPALVEQGLVDDHPPVDANGYERWRRSKGIQIGRILGGKQNFPLKWKWSWIQCLPEKYQILCRKDLLALAGVLDIPLPPVSTSGTSSAKANLSGLIREFSEVIDSSAPALDGCYDHLDDKNVSIQFVNELTDLIEICISEINAVCRGTGVSGSRHTYSGFSRNLLKITR